MLRIYFLCLLLCLTACKKEPLSEVYIVPHEPSSTVESLQINSAPQSKIQWTLPKEWKELPSSGIRLGYFKVEKENKSADISITSFPGKTGDLLSNVNRWRGQLQLEPILLNEIGTFTEVIKEHTPPFTIVRIKNKETKQATTVALIQIKNKSWFVKLMGDSAIVSEEDMPFIQFVKTIQFNEK